MLCSANDTLSVADLFLLAWLRESETSAVKSRRKGIAYVVVRIRGDAPPDDAHVRPLASHVRLLNLSSPSHSPEEYTLQVDTCSYVCENVQVCESCTSEKPLSGSSF